MTFVAILLAKVQMQASYLTIGLIGSAYATMRHYLTITFRHYNLIRAKRPKPLRS